MMRYFEDGGGFAGPHSTGDHSVPAYGRIGRLLKVTTQEHRVFTRGYPKNDGLLIRGEINSPTLWLVLPWQEALM